MPRYGKETKNEVRQSVAGLQGVERTARVHEWAMVLNVAPSTVYRWLETGRSTRLPRTDRGTRKIDQEIVQKMAALTVRYDFTGEEVIEQAELNGWIEAGSLSPATYNRYLTGMGVARKNLLTPGKPGERSLLKNRLKRVPHRRWQAAASNDLHQIDVTELPRYYVSPDGSIGFESALTLGRNKRGNAQPRLQLFGLVDDFSRVAYANFYYGKNTLNWIDFCMRSWDTKEDSGRFPFCGRPRDLYSDNDSAPKSGMFTQFIKDLDVKFSAHLVGNPKAKGKIERRLGDLAQRVTRLLRVCIDRGVQVTLAEANELLMDQIYKVNFREHSVTGEKPMLRWLAGMAGAARMLPSPELRERYFYDSTRAVVNSDLTIRFGGQAWQLPRKEPFVTLASSGARIDVYWHRGQTELARILVVVDSREYAIEERAAVADPAGDIRSLPKGRTEELLQQIYEDELADFTLQKANRDRYAHLMMPAAQEAFDDERVSGPKRLLSPIQLKLRLAADGVPFEGDVVDRLYAERGEVLESEYEEIAAQLRRAG